MAIGGLVSLRIFKQIPITVTELQRDHLPNVDNEFSKHNFARYRCFGNHWTTRCASLVLALLAFLVFIETYTGDNCSFWWGCAIYGRAGLLFSFIVFLMMYYGTQILFLTAAASLMIAKLFSLEMQLRPFHADGCNGLRPVGKLLFLLWLISILLAAAVFVAMGIGYIGIEKTPIGWTFAMLATSTIPLIAIVPLFSVVRATQRARDKHLEKLEPLLDSALSSVVESRDNPSGKRPPSHSCKFENLRAVHGLLKDLNIWPFNPRALTMVMAIYAAQFLLTLREFLGTSLSKLVAH